MTRPHSSPVSRAMLGCSSSPGLKATCERYQGRCNVTRWQGVISGQAPKRRSEAAARQPDVWLQASGRSAAGEHQHLIVSPRQQLGAAAGRAVQLEEASLAVSAQHMLPRGEARHWPPRVTAVDTPLCRAAERQHPAAAAIRTPLLLLLRSPRGESRT